MIKLVLLTGFLGAGKTTFLNHILEEYKSSKIGIIVNEFSNKGIDGELIKGTDSDFDMIELNNGSIFCACIKDTFVDSLIELSKHDLEYTFIEASGLADPSSISSILDQLGTHTKNNYEYCGAVCLTDGLYFMKYFALLPALKRQLQYSKAVLINKMDLASEEDIEIIEKTIKEVNPLANIYKTTYGQVSMSKIISEFDGDNLEAQDSTNTEDTRPKTVTLTTKETISKEDLNKFITEISKYTFRIKGFCKTTEGAKAISVVTEVSSIDSWDVNIDETQLVIISSVGIKIVSIILSAAKKYFNQPISLK